MTELIKISTGLQGQSVVSARELHAFLEVKTRFATWIERRIREFDFLVNKDYVILLPTQEGDSGTVPKFGNGEKEVFPKNGNGQTNRSPNQGDRGQFQATEYALTLGMAKELSMVERNAQGKQARQYFIQCEETLQKVVTQPLGPAQDIILGQSQRLNQLEQKLDQFLNRQQQAATALLALPRSTEPVPEETTRAKVQRIINAYCQAKSLSQQEVWRKVYDRLYYAYRISIRRHKKRSERESWLDVAERCGHIDKLFAIVSQELILS